MKINKFYKTCKTGLGIFGAVVCSYVSLNSAVASTFQTVYPTKVYQNTINPTHSAGETVTVTGNNFFSASNGASGLMLAAIRYKDADGKYYGNYPGYGIQSAFDIVALAESYNGSTTLQFTADGKSKYTILAFPELEASDETAALPQADFNVSCQHTNSGCDVSTTRITIGGTIIRQLSGNSFAVSSFSGLDTKLFAMRIYQDADDAAVGGFSLYKGYGVENDDFTGLNPKVRDGSFRLKGRWEDIVLVGTYWSTSPGSQSALFSSTTESSVKPYPGSHPGINNSTDCIAPANAAGIKNTLEEMNCFKESFGFITEEPEDWVIPYEVAHPFWSDGVIKERYISFKGNQKIVVNSGKLELPAGAVMIKNFRFGGKIFETRVVAKATNGDRLAFTYRWDYSGGVATTKRVDHLVFGHADRTKPLSGDQVLQNRDWDYPGEKENQPGVSECNDCHLEGTNSTDEDFFLGLKARQLDMDSYYPSIDGRAPQILSLISMGAMAGVPPSKPTLLPRADTAEGAAYVGTQEQARVAIDVNCAYCHGDEGVRDKGSWDGDWYQALADVSICSNLAPPTIGGSILGFMNAKAMPPLALSIADEHGSIESIEAWISQQAPNCGLENKEIRLVQSQDCIARTGVTLNTGLCNNGGSQRFYIVDEGDGYISIRHGNNCVIRNSSGDIRIQVCGTNKQEWYRDWKPSGSYMLRHKTYSTSCLSNSSPLRLESCGGWDNQLWVDYDQ